MKSTSAAIRVIRHFAKLAALVSSIAFLACSRSNATAGAATTTRASATPFTTLNPVFNRHLNLARIHIRPVGSRFQSEIKS